MGIEETHPDRGSYSEKADSTISSSYFLVERGGSFCMFLSLGISLYLQDESVIFRRRLILSICDWINQLLAIQVALLGAERHQSMPFPSRR